MTTLALPSIDLDDPALPEATTAASSVRRGRATAFCFAWSAYLLLHHTMVYWAWFRFRDAAGRLDLIEPFIGLALWVVAAIALLRPGSLRWFTALLVCHLVYELPALPKTANHTLLTIFINVTMLAVIVTHAARSRGLHDRDVDAFFPQMAALLRLQVLAMYFFVVLHKLNSDYFDPAYSCATQLYADIVKDHSFLPSGAWTDPLSIYGALACEAAIPLLLIFPRTRLAGVGLGLLFHFMLSPHPNRFIYSFSAMLYAAYFLFLPQDVLGEMMATWARLLAALRRRWRWFVLAGAGAASIVVLLRLTAPAFVRETKLIDHAHVLISAGIRFGWNLLALFNIYAFAHAVRTCSARTKAPVESPAPPPPPPSRSSARRSLRCSSFRCSSCSTASARTSGSRPSRPSRCTPTCARKARGTTTCSCRGSTWRATRRTSSRSSTPPTGSSASSSATGTGGPGWSSAASSRASAAIRSG
ncbi:MAG: hypothetical protein WBD40_08355 [Tepidisphaeraceae bacterium]